MPKMPDYPQYPEYPSYPLYESAVSEKPAEEPVAITEESEPPVESPPPSEQSEIDEVELPRVLELLTCLKGMTKALPKKQCDSYASGKIQPALESVIDSLKNLTIIKERDANGS
jgi:hypothetical protein